MTAGEWILEYLWHLKEFDEWDQRFHVGDKKAEEKRDYWLDYHERSAKEAWSNLDAFLGRRLIVDGKVFMVRTEHDDWKKLIVEQEMGVIA